jgi:hypothetical protein
MVVLRAGMSLLRRDHRFGIHHVAGAACRSAQVWRCDRQPSACRDAVSSLGDLAEHHLVNSLHHLAELAAPTSAGAG